MYIIKLHGKLGHRWAKKVIIVTVNLKTAIDKP